MEAVREDITKKKREVGVTAWSTVCVLLQDGTRGKRQDPKGKARWCPFGSWVLGLLAPSRSEVFCAPRQPQSSRVPTLKGMMQNEITSCNRWQMVRRPLPGLWHCINPQTRTNPGGMPQWGPRLSCLSFRRTEHQTR